MPNLPLDLISGIVGFVLTLMVLSYLIGDNPLFRIATYLFVGVTAGYIASVVIYQVVLPYLVMPWVDQQPGAILTLVPLFLFVLMLMKISPRLSRLGGPAVGYVAGVGAGVAVGGAILGTILPQVLASANGFDMRIQTPLEALINGSLLLLGTVTTLVYFNFGARRANDGTVRRGALAGMLAWIGQLFLAITFGVLFAGVYSAALAALIERLASLIGLFFK
jgi:hypothetical protein